mgnify:CR=1 FL=1
MESRLPEKTLTLWQIRFTAVFAVLIGVLAFFLKYSKWLFIPISIIAALGAVFIIWFLPLYFKSFIITVNDTAIKVSRGVFFKLTNIMPYPRLVFAQSFSTPVARRFGLTGVTLRAARGLLVIPEMNIDDAKVLLDGLSGGRKN